MSASGSFTRTISVWRWLRNATDARDLAEPDHLTARRS